MYAITKRTDPDPTLNALDAPDGTASCPSRRRTNTPIQSLTLLNDPVFVAATRALAKSADHDATTDFAQRIFSLFSRYMSREPTSAELNTLTELFQDDKAEYRDRPQQAAALAHVDPHLENAAEAAAWFAVYRTILNLDETVSRE